MAEPRAHRITPTPRPNGADLHIEGFVSALLTDLVDLLGREPDLMDRLVAIVDGDQPKPDPFRPEAELPTEGLVADLSDRLPTAIWLHRPEMHDLSERLRRMYVEGARPLPQWRRPELPKQQNRRAS